MKILFVTLLMLFSVPLLANDNWVYTYNDATILKAVFNYLAMIKEDKTYQTLLQVSIASGILVSALMKRLSPYSTMTTFAGTTLLITGIFAATTTVHVMNVKTYNSSTTTSNNYAAIDNVPYLMAFLTSSFSTVGYGTARTIEDTLHVATDSPTEYQSTSFLNAGMNGSFKLYEGLNRINFSSISPEANELINIYKSYNQLCIKEIAYPLNRDAVYTLLINSKNLLQDINPESTNEVINVVKNQMVDTKFGTITCNELWKKADEYKNNLLAGAQITDAIKQRFKNFTGDAIEATSSVTALYAGAQGSNPEERLKNYMLATATLQSFKAPWSTSEQQGAYGTGLTVAQLQQMGQVNAQTASIMIPAMHSIMQALIYVSFPVIFLVMVAAGNFQVISIYIKTLLWIELWVPNFSILNFFIQREASSQALDKMIAASSGFSTQDPLSLINLANQAEVYSTIATQGAVAANMLWSVPMLAGFMMFGSFHSLMGVGGTIMKTAMAQGQVENQLDQKNLAAAADRINQGIKDKNPLYTGDIGDAIGMQKNLSHTNSLSQVAASEALGGIDRYTDTKVGKSTYDLFQDQGFVKALGSNLASTATSSGQWNAADSVAKASALALVGNDTLTSSKFMEYANGAYKNSEYKDKMDDIANTYKNVIGDQTGDGKMNWADTAMYLAKGGADNDVTKAMGSANAALNTNDQQQIKSSQNTTLSGYLPGTVETEKYIDAQKLKIEKELGEASAATSIAAITGQSRESWINSSAHFKAAQDAGNINAMTKIAEDTTGKKGDEAIKTFQEMQSRTGVSYTKGNVTILDNYGQDGQLVSSKHTWTDEKGQNEIFIDKNGDVRKSTEDGNFISTHVTKDTVGTMKEYIFKTVGQDEKALFEQISSKGEYQKLSNMEKLAIASTPNAWKELVESPSKILNYAQTGEKHLNETMNNISNWLDKTFSDKKDDNNTPTVKIPDRPINQ